MGAGAPAAKTAGVTLRLAGGSACPTRGLLLIRPEVLRQVIDDGVELFFGAVGAAADHRIDDGCPFVFGAALSRDYVQTVTIGADHFKQLFSLACRQILSLGQRKDEKRENENGTLHIHT